jgi:hypothetical protein
VLSRTDLVQRKGVYITFLSTPRAVSVRMDVAQVLLGIGRRMLVM